MTFSCEVSLHKWIDPSVDRQASETPEFFTVKYAFFYFSECLLLKFLKHAKFEYNFKIAQHYYIAVLNLPS